MKWRGTANERKGSYVASASGIIIVMRDRARARARQIMAS